MLISMSVLIFSAMLQRFVFTHKRKENENKKTDTQYDHLSCNGADTSAHSSLASDSKVDIVTVNVPYDLRTEDGSVCL